MKNLMFIITIMSLFSCGDNCSVLNNNDWGMTSLSPLSSADSVLCTYAANIRNCDETTETTKGVVEYGHTKTQTTNPDDYVPFFKEEFEVEEMLDSEVRQDKMPLFVITSEEGYYICKVYINSTVNENGEVECYRNDSNEENNMIYHEYTY